MEFDDSFRAMDTQVDVSIAAAVPPMEAFLSVRLLFEHQEARFSRFRADSLLARLNRGEDVDDTWLAEVCRLALDAYDATGGLFNPLVYDALVTAGYDRTFSEVAGGRPAAAPAPDLRACLDVRGDTVRLRGGRLDLGGIVKGWTVDLAVSLVAGGYEGVLVNAGGDLRAAGSSDTGPGWPIEVEGPGGEALWDGIVTGAVATSTTARRRWRTDDGGEAHHLIDPRTGLPAQSPFVQVTTWAASAWLAEVWAKAVLVGGAETLAHAARHGIAAMAVAPDGTIEQAGRP